MVREEPGDWRCTHALQETMQLEELPEDSFIDEISKVVVTERIKVS